HPLRLLVGAAIEIPTDQLLAAGRGSVVALRGPHRPFAVGPAKDGDDQFLRFEFPQPQSLVVIAGDAIASVGGGCDHPYPALVAVVVVFNLSQVIALERAPVGRRLDAREVVGIKLTVGPTRDDALAIRTEAVGPVSVAVIGVTLETGDHLAVAADVENGIVVT